MYFGYISLPGIQKHDQGNLERKPFIWGLNFQVIKAHNHHVRDHDSRQATKH